MDANQALYDLHYYDGYSEDSVRNHAGRSTMPPGHREKIRESMLMDAMEKRNQEDPGRARKILYAFQYRGFGDLYPGPALKNILGVHQRSKGPMQQGKLIVAKAKVVGGETWELPHVYLALNPEKKPRNVEKEWAKLCNGGKAELDWKEIPEDPKMKAGEVSKVFSEFESGRANKW